MEVAEFMLAELPPPPSRVLEVGCGRGELVGTLAARGYDVLGIDPEAPDGPLFLRTTIEDLAEPGPFETVVASRSLHHVKDLAAALDKVAEVLSSGGTFVLDEFAWERLDARTAEEVGIELAEWRREHDDLHTSTAMLAGLELRFTGRSLTWEPYLHREARQAVSEEVERELIEAGRIQATGFRYVGMR